MRSVRPLVALLLLLFTAQTFVNVASAWSNGGYSSSPSNPDYGTHDWIAEHAKNWLPSVERKWIDDNLNRFLYGTEYPDNSGASYGTTRGYGDTTKHHNYYDSSSFVTDASAAIRAREEYDKALTELRAGRNDTAAIYAGSMTHYIADVAVFGHVMTGEIHHSDYEDYVQARTTSYIYGVFESYLVFDGKLGNVSAYDASISLGWDTFNDDGGTYTARWMDANYNWGNPAFKNRCGESLNLAANYVTDVLQTLVVAAFGTTAQAATITVGTDKTSYGPGNILKVSGTASPVTAGQDVAILVYDPSGALRALAQVTPSSTGSYSEDFLTFSSNDPTGTWTVKATYQGVSAIITFTFAVPIGTGTFTPSSPTLLDSTGHVITSVSSNTAFFIQVKLASNVGTSLSVYLIAQIKEATGRVAAMGITAADIGAGATKDVPVAFLGIATPDTYTVILFVWSSTTNPTPLAPKTTFTITIAKQS